MTSSAARYVAIITDGNGRWAQQRGLPHNDGHEAGADTVKARLRDAVEFGVEELTRLLVLHGELVAPRRRRSRASWRCSPADRARDARAATPRACGCGSSAGATAWPTSCARRWRGPRRRRPANDRITLFVAFNYGGRAEILDAAARYEGGGEEAFKALLYAPEMHDPDLIIRTSGEQRLIELPDLAVRVRGARVRRRAVAGLHPRGVPGLARRVRRAPAPIRRPLMARPRRPAGGPRLRARGSASSSRSRRSSWRCSSSTTAACRSRSCSCCSASPACTSCSRCSTTSGRSGWPGSSASSACCWPRTSVAIAGRTTS